MIKRGWSRRETSEVTLTEKSNILERQQERLRLDLRKDFLKAKESYKDLRKL